MSRGRVGPGEHDLLTCGRCQTNFLLGDILVFIEHKRRLCSGGGRAPGGFSKPGERGTPILARGGAVPVEVGVQVTPHGEEEEERRLTPAKGICPKQERGNTGHSAVQRRGLIKGIQDNSSGLKRLFSISMWSCRRTISKL
uniref:BCL-11A-like CCHC zinc finger domain-containing protein n=1 Tax=Salmo trutta TaxID=8032 RepID=A0A673ZS63_SALTR